jgi:hypothetical protein
MRGLRGNVLRVDRDMKGEVEAVRDKSITFRTTIIWVERWVLVLQCVVAQ